MIYARFFRLKQEIYNNNFNSPRVNFYTQKNTCNLYFSKICSLIKFPTKLWATTSFEAIHLAIQILLFAMEFGNNTRKEKIPCHTIPEKACQPTLNYTRHP